MKDLISEKTIDYAGDSIGYEVGPSISITDLTSVDPRYFGIYVSSK